MPARSQQQQKFMGLALAYKRGQVPASKVSDRIKQIAKSMSEKELEKYAGTSQKGLPKRVESADPIDEATIINGVKLSPKAQEEVKKYNLANNQEYLKQLKVYADAYSKRKPSGIPVKNMLKALRMSTYMNTPDDWARLHATEYFMRKRTEQTESIGFKDEKGQTNTVHGHALKNTSHIRESFDVAKMNPAAIKELKKIISKAVSSVLNESTREKQEDPLLTPEQKREFIEQVSRFNEYGRAIYRQNNLKEAYKNIKSVVEFASKHITEESGDWFDQVTLGRHSKKLKESMKIFEKTVAESVKLQQRLESVYEEIGETLSKYYSIDETPEDPIKESTQPVKEAEATPSNKGFNVNILYQTKTGKPAQYKAWVKANDEQDAIKKIEVRVKQKSDFGKIVGGDAQMMESTQPVKDSVVTETDGEAIFYAFWNNNKHEIKAKDLYAAKLAAIAKFKIPKSKQGLLAIMSKKAYDQQEFRYN